MGWLNRDKTTLFLWDIDGTLLLTGGAGITSFNRVFEELYGERHVWKDLHPDGKTDDAIIEELFFQHFGRLPNLQELTRIAVRYSHVMGEELDRSERFRLMPHALETVDQLSKKPGVTLGLCTGNYELAAIHKLKRGGLSDYFLFGGFGSDHRDRLKLTEIALLRAADHLGFQPDQVFVVGDTVHDVRCGKGVGAKTIAVCTGSTPRSLLEKAGADWVLDDLSQFTKLALT